MRNLKPQRGNPHQLTVKQHFFPKKSIERFTDQSGVVQVYLIGEGKVKTLKADNPIFCAQRVWDQRSENTCKQEIEDPYQELADSIAEGPVKRCLRESEQQVVSKMYALWNIRWHWSKQQIADQIIKGVEGVAVKYSVDHQELLEKNHITPIRSDASISKHHITGVQIQRNLIAACKELENTVWGIFKCRGGQLVVPDNCGKTLYLPVTPEICLTNFEGNRVATEQEFSAINERLKQNSETYYFANQLQPSKQ